ncbi:MAG: hypothetical protein ACLPY5_12140 [Candidatus Bathyarchaeia archaeon]
MRKRLLLIVIGLCSVVLGVVVFIGYSNLTPFHPNVTTINVTTIEGYPSATITEVNLQFINYTSCITAMGGCLPLNFLTFSGSVTVHIDGQGKFDLLLVSAAIGKSSFDMIPFDNFTLKSPLPIDVYVEVPSGVSAPQSALTRSMASLSLTINGRWTPSGASTSIIVTLISKTTIFWTAG